MLVNVPENIDCVDVGKWWELFACINACFFVYLHVDAIIVCIDIGKCSRKNWLCWY